MKLRKINEITQFYLKYLDIQIVTKTALSRNLGRETIFNLKNKRIIILTISHKPQMLHQYSNVFSIEESLSYPLGTSSI